MLSLDKQNQYRARLLALAPEWMPATEVYEATIRQYLRPGVRLLDAGCGRGGVVEQLQGEQVWMVGIDPDTASLREHRLRPADTPRPRLSAAFLDRLPFAASTFDLVIASWVLEHLAMPSAAFAEAARILRPGGHLIALAPNGWHPVSLLNRLLAQRKPLQAWLVPRLYSRGEADAFPVRYRANSVRRLRRLGEEAGLTTVAIQTISDPTYLAFSDALFAVSRALEGLLPAGAWVHIVADFAR